MSIIEVRNRFHALIEEVENPQLLQKFLDILSTTAHDKNSKLLSSLSEVEKNDLIKSYEESKDEGNLIAHEEVMNKYSKWRKK